MPSALEVQYWFPGVTWWHRAYWFVEPSWFTRHDPPDWQNGIPEVQPHAYRLQVVPELAQWLALGYISFKKRLQNEMKQNYNLFFKTSLLQHCICYMIKMDCSTLAELGVELNSGHWDPRLHQHHMAC